MLWEIETNLDTDQFDLSKDGEKVSIPFQDLELKGFESSQEYEDPVGDLSEPANLVIIFEGQEYPIAAYSDLDTDTSFMVLEWYSPT